MACSECGQPNSATCWLPTTPAALLFRVRYAGLNLVARRVGCTDNGRFWCAEKGSCLWLGAFVASQWRSFAPMSPDMPVCLVDADVAVLWLPRSDAPRRFATTLAVTRTDDESVRPP